MRECVRNALAGANKAIGAIEPLCILWRVNE